MAAEQEPQSITPRQGLFRWRHEDGYDVTDMTLYNPATNELVVVAPDVLASAKPRPHTPRRALTYFTIDHSGILH